MDTNSEAKDSGAIRAAVSVEQRSAEVAGWSWKNEPELMARLTRAQNTEANWNQDVMTFAGMCSSREELERHVIACERREARRLYQLQ